MKGFDEVRISAGLESNFFNEQQGNPGLAYQMHRNQYFRCERGHVSFESQLIWIQRHRHSKFYWSTPLPAEQSFIDRA